MWVVFALARLVAVLGLSVGPAAAASFNFSYTFEDGTIVLGTLDGDISVTDANLVENVVVTTASLNGIVPFLDPILTAPDEPLASFPDSDTVSFDGSGMDLAVFASTATTRALLFTITAEGQVSAELSSLVGLVTDPVYEPSRWALTPVPEPDTGMLVGLGGLLMAWRARRPQR